MRRYAGMVNSMACSGVFEPRNIASDRRMRLHWRELRAIRGAEPSTRAHHRARQADVRRQSGEHRRPAAVAGRSCRRGHLRRRAIGAYRARSRRHCPLRCGIAQRQFHRQSRTVHPHERGRHNAAVGGRPATRRALPPHQHRRGIRRSGAGRSGAFHGRHAVPSFKPVQRLEGVVRPSGARMGAHIRSARHHLQLLQQLRPVPACGKVHSTADHLHHEGRAAETVRHRRERARLDTYGRPLPARCGRSSPAGASAKRI